MGSPAKDAVNNFVAGEFTTSFGWPVVFISVYSLMRIPRAGRSGLPTISRVNDVELYRPPAGTWPSSNYSRGVCLNEATLLYWRRRVKSTGDHHPNKQREE